VRRRRRETVSKPVMIVSASILEWQDKKKREKKREMYKLSVKIKKGEKDGK